MWRKLDAKIGADARLAALAQREPLAALLFTWSIASADAYGLLPGEPREYRAVVAPALMCRDARIERAIVEQEKAGLIHRYTTGFGDLVVYIRHFHRYQSVNWWGLGRSRWELPECWEIPPELAELLASGRAERANRRWGRFGWEGGGRVGGGLGEGGGRGLPGGSQGAGRVGGGSGELDIDKERDKESYLPRYATRSLSGDGSGGGKAVENYGKASMTDDSLKVGGGNGTGEAADWPALAEAVRGLRFEGRARERWLQVLAFAIEHGDHWATEGAVVRLLGELAPLPEEEWLPQRWLERAGQRVAEEQRLEEAERLRMAAARGMLGSLRNGGLPRSLWEGALAEYFGRRVARAVLEEYRREAAE